MEERGGHQLAVVAYRGGQLYCNCTMSWDGEGHRSLRISWPSSPIGVVSRTACEEQRRAEERKEKEEEVRKVTEENLTTTTLTVGKKTLEY